MKQSRLYAIEPKHVSADMSMDRKYALRTPLQFYASGPSCDSGWDGIRPVSQPATPEPSAMWTMQLPERREKSHKNQTSKSSAAVIRAVPKNLSLRRSERCVWTQLGAFRSNP